jgi:hypothetical protein
MALSTGRLQVKGPVERLKGQRSQNPCRFPDGYQPAAGFAAGWLSFFELDTAQLDYGTS